MSNTANYLYEFGPFHLDPKEKLLLRNNERVPLTPKAFETLTILLERNGQAVEKEELMRLLWPDVAVEENNLSQNIHAVRKALGENSQSQQYIETLPRRGFRFVADIRTVPVTQEITLTPQPLAVPEIATPPIPVMSDTAPSSNRMWWGFGALAILATLASLFLWRSSGNEPASFDKLKLARLTTTSNSWDVALSPDGKTLAYVLGDAGAQSLRLKNLETESATELIPPTEARFRGITFSPDGNFIFYCLKEKDAPVFTLYQRHLYSNEQKILLSHVDSAVSFSPDGKQIAFVREDQTKGESILLIANADGTAEQILAAHKSPDFYSVDGLSWSADGKLLAIAVAFPAPAFHFRLVTIQVNDGKEQFIGNSEWDWARDVAWLENGQGLILLGKEKNNAANNNQVWRIEFPTGQAHKLLNDLNDYRGLSLSKNSQKLVTVQAETRANISLLPQGEARAPQSLTDDPLSQNGVNGIDWTPDGQIVFTSLRSGQQDLWLSNSKNQTALRLTSDGKDKVTNPSVSRDGKYIVFNAGRSGYPLIWRIDADGKNPQALTKTNFDLQPFCSSQADWFVYSSAQNSRRTIWKLPLEKADTATPEPITELFGEFPIVSPDGQLIACHYQANANAPRQIAVFSQTGGTPQKLLNIPVFAELNLRWHPDGQGLTYLSRQDNSTNIWWQDLQGGKPKQLTNFTGERIFAYAWSRDKKTLAVSRGIINRDVVLLQSMP